MHIDNFYDDLELELKHIPTLIDEVCHGELKEVTEKLDGQNFTFTVIPGPEVRFLGKGLPKSLVSIGGLDRSGLTERFASTPSIRDTFTTAYDVLQRLFEQMPETYVMKEFNVKVGGLAWSSEILCPETRNIVSYPQKSIRLISSMMIHPHTYGLVDPKKFTGVCEQLTRDDEWKVGPVPKLKQRQRLDAADKARLFKEEWAKLTKYGTRPTTMGQLRTYLVIDALQERAQRQGGWPWSADLQRSAASRLALGDKTLATKKQFKPADWTTFQELEADSTFLNEALQPLELFFRRLGSYALETVDPVLAEASQRDLDMTIGQVKRVQRALKEGKVRADPKVLKRIESANRRCPSWLELGSLYTKNMEGIVFEGVGGRRKLTGYYTPINRLLGYFRFGQNPATIV